MKITECSIVKHAVVKLAEGKIMTVCWCSHTEADRTKAWYKCYAKIWTPDEIEALCQKFMKSPAEYTTLEEIGITDAYKGYNVYYARGTWTHTSTAGWLRDRFKKPITPEEYFKTYFTGKTPMMTEFVLLSDGKTPLSLKNVEEVNAASFEGWAGCYIPHKRELPKVKKPKKLLPGAEPATPAT